MKLLRVAKLFQKYAGRMFALMSVLLMMHGSVAFAQFTQQDLDSVLGQTPFFNPSEICDSSPTGSAPTNIPACGCKGSPSAPVTNSEIVWPFATKAASQYNRVDQGWDIQTNAGGAVFAIAPGTIHQFAPDPGGFGNNFPTEQLDVSIGGPSEWIFYGHVHVLPQVVNQHVNAGQQIAVTNTSDPENGSAAPVGWLEIGFAQPGTDAPLQRSSENVATQAGQDMKNILINAQPTTGSVTQPSPNTGTCTCSASTLTPGSPTAPPNQLQVQNAMIIMGIAKTENLGQAGALVGLMVGLDESKLLILANINVPVSLGNPAKQGLGADHDSVGVFQQRPSTSWSTLAPNGGAAADSNQAAVWQLMDPAYATEAFFGSPPGSNAPSPLSKGLQNIAGWQSLPSWVAAQKVQASGVASGFVYQQEIPYAQALLNQYWSSAPAVPLPIPLSGGSGVSPTPC